MYHNCIMSKSKQSVSRKKNVYYFGKTRCDGNSKMHSLLGGKGAELAEMARLGLPIPPGFTITTQACSDFFNNSGKLSPALLKAIDKNIEQLNKETGKTFGSVTNPLLLSVRSGAAISMPGMMDTVLNLGLNDKSVEGLAKISGSKRFALDAYRRLINMFGDVVMGVDHKHFEQAFTRIKRKYKVKNDIDLNENGLLELIELYKAIYKKHTRRVFPQDPVKQLTLSIEAIFRSWHNPRAITYRRINKIEGLSGTAVNLQSMVFGNLNDRSASGVAFTRDPGSGKNEFYGEFLINAQGEDVVAGIRTPKPVSEMKQWQPDSYKKLLKVKNKLEKHYRDVQDLEFTIEDNELFILQTRTGKRTGVAAIKIAVDMVNEKLINKKTALLRLTAEDVTQCLLPSFIEKEKKNILTKGLPASPGAASGYPVFDPDEAVIRKANGEKVILVNRETSPEAIHGMEAAEGILTSTGGTTSHAAVVARGWGKCCITGAADVEINERSKTMTINGKKITRKDVISIDGNTGEVMLGDIPKQPPGFSSEFKSIMNWTDKFAKLEVRTNADTPKDAKLAREFGATGIGLCRTEHMFFGEQRILAMREMILAEDEANRRVALRKLLPHQRRDFEGLFRAMNNLPVTIRLIDPPLHEFLPQERAMQQQLAKTLGVSLKHLQHRVQQLHESNPMLGHRGCRLTITYPEIMEMQVTAIIEATINTRKRGIKAKPEIMIPLVGIETELAYLREKVEETIEAIKKRKHYNGKLDIPIGTMIEIPRAALTANAIAKHADFFSFGTNDLTQMTLGFSRDDFGSFMPNYLDKHIYKTNPFQSIDETGVGQLVDMSVKRGRKTKAKLKCGICGEHGGDPDSIKFFAKAGLNYVSCSPFRVPVARLASAQSNIKK
jgi:pyruvate, orthophosphate dikinase